MLKFLLITAMLGCASPEGSTIKPDALEYKLSMKTGFGRGLVALESNKAYDFKFRWKERAELIKITTCHREIVIEANRIFRSKKKFNWRYVPTSLELDGVCPVFIGAYDTKGQHSWAYVDFRLPTEKLKAHVDCSGLSLDYVGLSVCQARKGLTQRISFESKVIHDVSTGCSELIDVGNNSFEISVERGLCHYVFSDVKSKQVHRLTVYGYEDVLLREFKIEVQ
ncbi:MAG: hypothetical protein IME94_05540 [Proteobacteria bacterium]|nr:hypothetical protein [Pseudomonadota bacterium]